jgi:cytochrome c oxidase subunit II
MTIKTIVATVAMLTLTACSGQSDGDLSGVDLATEVGCTACHGDVGTDLAPTLHGVWGNEVNLADGTTLVADETYVRRSILDPSADIVAGYETRRMPTFGLSESEVDRLVDYVRSLG